jgi:hypothetical protein
MDGAAGVGVGVGATGAGAAGVDSAFAAATGKGGGLGAATGAAGVGALATGAGAGAEAGAPVVLGRSLRRIGAVGRRMGGGGRAPVLPVLVFAPSRKRAKASCGLVAEGAAGCGGAAGTGARTTGIGGGGAAGAGGAEANPDGTGGATETLAAGDGPVSPLLRAINCWVVGKEGGRVWWGTGLRSSGTSTRPLWLGM